MHSNTINYTWSKMEGFLVLVLVRCWGHHFNTESQESRHCILDTQILPRVGSDPPKRLTVGPRRNDNTTGSIKPSSRILMGLQHAHVQQLMAEIRPENLLRLVVSPIIIYKVLYIPGGAGFLPSTLTSVCLFRGEIWPLFFSHLCLPDSWRAFPAALSCMRLPKSVCLCGSFVRNRNWTELDTLLATAFQDNQSDKNWSRLYYLQTFTNLYPINVLFKEQT